MICIYCLHQKTTTPNSRPHKAAPVTWRRRACPQCHNIFTTYERPSLEDVTIVSDASLTHPQKFSLGELAHSIYDALPHSKSRANDSYELARSVELHIIKKYDIFSPITRRVLAKESYEIVKRFDAVAGLQYAAQHQLITSIRRRGRPSTTATSDDDDSVRV